MLSYFENITPKCVQKNKNKVTLSFLQVPTQAFLGQLLGDEIRAPLKTLAWQVTILEAQCAQLPHPCLVYS